MGKTIGNCIIIVYVAIAILVTVCLLSFNDKKITQFGTKSLIIINKDDEDFKYKKGDLVILDSENYEQAQEGDTLFFYNNDNVKIAKVRERLDYNNGVINYKVDESSFEVIKDDIIRNINK